MLRKPLLSWTADENDFAGNLWLYRGLDEEENPNFSWLHGTFTLTKDTFKSGNYLGIALDWTQGTEATIQVGGDLVPSPIPPRVVVHEGPGIFGLGQLADKIIFALPGMAAGGYKLYKEWRARRAQPDDGGDGDDGPSEVEMTPTSSVVDADTHGSRGIQTQDSPTDESSGGEDEKKR